MKQKSLPWPTSNPRAREEWDFRARFADYNDREYGPFDFLPDTELAFCNYYEFDRHSNEVGPVLERRKRCRELTDWQQSSKTNNASDESLAARAFDALLAEYSQSDSNGKGGFSLPVNWFYQTWPEWPEMPYLFIPARERRRRFKAMWGNDRRRTLRTVPLSSIHKDFVSFSKGELPQRFRYVRGAFAVDTPSWVIPGPPATENCNSKEVVAFEIDYAYSNKTILKLLENYLVQRRKQQGYRDRGTVDLRVEKVRWRSELVAIGAGRLINSGFTYKQAAAFTKRMTGLSLYIHESAWTRAMAGVRGCFGPD